MTVPRSSIRVALTEGHGMAMELVRSPPDGIDYSFIAFDRETPSWIRSPINGFLRTYSTAEHDLIEAVLCPVFTRNKWICSLACFQEALAFSYGGVPTPRAFRRALIERLFAQPHFKALVFWSHAGRRTLESYGAVTDPRVLEKAKVIYPAVGRAPDGDLANRARVRQLLFTGDFFRKGGVNVVDAFIELRKRHADLELLVCADERIDFRTSDSGLRERYLSLLRSTPGIHFTGRIPRDRLLGEILPVTDVYLLPTYAETFGFAILEAMSFGIPVVATNVFAIPEMVTSGTTGLLIDVSRFDVERLFQSYTVGRIPADFRRHVTTSLRDALQRLIDDPSLFRQMQAASLAKARSTFSSKRRDAELSQLYARAVG